VLEFLLHLLVEVDSSRCVQDRSDQNQEQEESPRKGISAIRSAEVNLHREGQEVHDDEGDPRATENYHVPDVAQV